MLKDDLDKLESVANQGCKEFLIFLNKKYVPKDKKLTLTEDNLNESSIKRTMILKFLPIFHPDKNMDEERKV